VWVFISLFGCVCTYMEEVLDGTDPLQLNEGSLGDLRDEDRRTESVLSIGGAVYQKEQLRLQQQRQSAWVSCLCVVKFDTDYGPGSHLSHLSPLILRFFTFSVISTSLLLIVSVSLSLSISSREFVSTNRLYRG